MSVATYCRTQREGFEAVKREATARGLDAAVVRAGKHMIVEVRDANGNHRRIALSGSPRTDGHINFARQRARAAIKQLLGERM